MNKDRIIPSISLTLLLSSSIEAQTPSAPNAQAAPAPTQQSAQLSVTEKHIRQGIILINELHKCLAAINNKDSADKAAVEILQYQLKLSQWGQDFSAVPSDEPEIQKSYTEAYLPIIQGINDKLAIQSERLAAAQYYQSRKLGAALIRLVDATK